VVVRRLVPGRGSAAARRERRSWAAEVVSRLDVQQVRGAVVDDVARYAREVDAASDEALPIVLAAAAEALDRPDVRTPAEPLRSYVDVSVQVFFLRELAERAASRLGRSSVAVLDSVLDARPGHRAAILALGEVALAARDVPGAIAFGKRALRIQAVCQTAERLLHRCTPLADAMGLVDPDLEPFRVDLDGRFCDQPFRTLSTGWAGATYACACPSWVPFSLGDIHEATGPDELWNSEVAQELRRSILDGDFRYCSRTQCSLIATDVLPSRDRVADPFLRQVIDEHLTILERAPSLVELNHDATCNLACPSCRTEVIAADRGQQRRDDEATDRVLLPLLAEVEGKVYISGGGEAIASPHLRRLLERLDRQSHPGLGVLLMTNAQLLTPRRWATLPNLPSVLTSVNVSIDAATAATYERLRPPGRWSVLLENLEHLAELRRTGEVPSLCFNFVVQQANFRELPAFIEMGDSFGADLYWLQKVTNYGTYDESTFVEVDVTARSHPEHEALLEVLRRPELVGNSKVDMRLLLHLLPEAPQAGHPLPWF
jgi:molybdenum cofactor biosynthesis enzyme MoaA